MFGPGRRVARRTARRTTRRQMAIQGAMSQPDPEPQYAAPTHSRCGRHPGLRRRARTAREVEGRRHLVRGEFEPKKKQILGI